MSVFEELQAGVAYGIRDQGRRAVLVFTKNCAEIAL